MTANLAARIGRCMQIDVQAAGSVTRERCIVQLRAADRPMTGIGNVLLQADQNTAILPCIGKMDMRGRRIGSTVGIDVHRYCTRLKIDRACGNRICRTCDDGYFLPATHAREQYFDGLRCDLAAYLAAEIGGSVDVNVVTSRTKGGQLGCIDGSVNGRPMSDIDWILA